MKSCPPSTVTSDKSYISLILGISILSLFGIYFVFISIQKGAFFSNFDSNNPIYFEIKNVEKRTTGYFAIGNIKGRSNSFEISIFEDDYVKFKKGYSINVFLMKDNPNIVIAEEKYNENKPIISIFGVHFSWHFWFGILAIVIATSIQFGLYRESKIKQVIKPLEKIVPIKPSNFIIEPYENQLILRYKPRFWVSFILTGCFVIVLLSIYYTIQSNIFIGITLLLMTLWFSSVLLKKPILTVNKTGSILYTWNKFFIRHIDEFELKNCTIDVTEEFETDMPNTFNVLITNTKTTEKFKVFNFFDKNHAFFIKNEIVNFASKSKSIGGGQETKND